jgi:ankyrin repeat protein
MALTLTYYGSALQVASNQVLIAMVELLLDNRADVDMQEGEYGPALQSASYGGSTAIVKLLLANGANINAQGGQHGTALVAASYSGKTAIVELLLANGADVNGKGGWCGNTLQAASYQGHTAIVKLLLENGANFNTQGVFSDALQAATKESYTELSNLLRNYGAVNSQRHDTPKKRSTEHSYLRPSNSPRQDAAHHISPSSSLIPTPSEAQRTSLSSPNQSNRPSSSFTPASSVLASPLSNLNQT